MFMLPACFDILYSLRWYLKHTTLTCNTVHLLEAQQHVGAGAASSSSWDMKVQHGGGLAGAGWQQQQLAGALMYSCWKGNT